MQDFFSHHRYLVALVVIIIGVVIITNLLPPPEALVLAVPFTDQAPTGKWDRNEDCEETSLAMAHAFLDGNHADLLPVAVAQKSIAQLRAWEAANIGYNADTGAYATSRMAEGTFGLKVKQIRDYSARDLKKALAQKHVVLLPIDARLLGNPAYTEAGPFYHMIVVRGYHGDQFVVNDPGTTKGNGQTYSFATLQKAAADWNNESKAIDATIKIALIVSK